MVVRRIALLVAAGTLAAGGAAWAGGERRRHKGRRTPTVRFPDDGSSLCEDLVEQLAAERLLPIPVWKSHQPPAGRHEPL